MARARTRGRRPASSKATNGTIIKDTKRVMIVDPVSLRVGMENEGWKLEKMYRHFNLWIKRTISGEILHECFRKYELPKRVNPLSEEK